MICHPVKRSAIFSDPSSGLPCDGARVRDSILPLYSVSRATKRSFQTFFFSVSKSHHQKPKTQKKTINNREVGSEVSNGLMKGNQPRRNLRRSPPSIRSLPCDDIPRVLQHDGASSQCCVKLYAMIFPDRWCRGDEQDKQQTTALHSSRILRNPTCPVASKWLQGKENSSVCDSLRSAPTRISFTHKKPAIPPSPLTLVQHHF